MTEVHTIRFGARSNFIQQGVLVHQAEVASGDTAIAPFRSGKSSAGSRDVIF